MKVMVLTPYLPHRQVGHGGGTAVRDLVTWLARSHEVLVASLVRPGEADRIDEVTALGVRVLALPFRDREATGADRLALMASRAGAAAAGLVSGPPFYVRKYWSGLRASRIRAAVADFAPDAIQIEYLQMGLYCRDLQRWRGTKPRPRLILNSHELGSTPRQRHADLARNPLSRAWHLWEAARWRRYQVAASGWADNTLCVTPEDRAQYAAQGGHNLVTMPLGMDTDALQADWSPAPPERHLFVGAFQHRPNRSAAEFLLADVWPRVRTARPGARLLLAGRGSREFLASRDQPAPDGVEALGFVDDLTPLFKEASLFVAPLTEGGGIKIKILEAMARGVPVVTSPVGAEGITADPDILGIARCDETFAELVTSLAADPQSCRLRSRTGRRLIEDHFSWRAIVARLATLYEG